MEATLTLVKNAQPMGEYKPTAVDAQKAAADFRLLDVSGRTRTIRWRDGRTEFVTPRQLKKLQATHTWACDF